MKRYLLIATLFLACSSDTITHAQVENVGMSAQEFKGQIELEASPADVWNALTEAKSICELLNYTLRTGPQNFSGVGDNVQLTVWSDNGTFIVTKYVPQKEIRFVWDPENATYFCLQQWALTAKGENTIVNFKLTYTESGSQTSEALAQQVDFYKKMLAKLKATVEKS